MKRKVPSAVWLLSLVSFFNDTASEMLYPVMPIFLTQVLGAPVFVVGIIEGIAEGTASVFKTLFGYWSDRLQKRKIFVVAGYGASAVSKIIIALSYTWPFVLLGRIVDRVGKGARTGARDALLLEATNGTNEGFIFGIHRALDTAGAVVGPLIALVLLWAFHNNIRFILYLAAVPAFIGLIFFIWVKDAKKNLRTAKGKLTLSIKHFSPKLKLLLLGLCVFSLGNSSDSFLILRAKNLGLSLTMVIVAYIVYNIVYALASTPAGILADKIGTKKVFIVGIIMFALVYAGFALNHNGGLVWLLFGFYGFYIALTDGVSKAMVGALISQEEAGTVYGVLGTATSLFTLVASVLGGFLWSAVSPAATFGFAVVCALLSLVIFAFIKTEPAAVAKTA
jgi:MFS family permease